MFNSNTLEYIKTLVLTQKNKGYDYYICHTNNGSTSSEYNAFCYFSKGEIIENSLYSFQLTSGVRYSLKNSYSSSHNIALIGISNYSDSNLNISNNNYVFTNAKNSKNSDLMASIVFNNENNISYNLDRNDYYLIPIILIFSILLTFLFRLFKRR